MTLNGVTSLILRYFTKFNIFGGLLRQSGMKISEMSVEYCLPLLAKTDPHSAARSLCDSWATY